MPTLTQWDSRILLVPTLPKSETNKLIMDTDASDFYCRLCPRCNPCLVSITRLMDTGATISIADSAQRNRSPSHPFG